METMDMVMLRLCEVMEKLRNNLLKTMTHEQAEMLMSLTIRQEKALVAVSNLAFDHRDQEGISLKALAERLDMTLPAASILVETMVRGGLFVRTPSPHDRRAVCIRLAPTGVAVFETIRAGVTQSLARLFANVPESDREAFARVALNLHQKVFGAPEPEARP